ncbi:hypothetical protein D0544_09375 [Aestuariirhabdus litorea]|uniref:ResB-like domain-containing protein n=1 Tax=Aestuariirhabdus litorea TaxID=2528527 RepID=A0A3P3VS31_9GAMM|nr:hypothetical protein D0544_09375 [Aestuariirhabdus litorea]
MLTRPLDFLASLRLTLVALVLLGGGVALVIQFEVDATPALAPAIGLLGLNLVSAILVKEKIRSSLPLLLFHLALLTLLVLLALSRATYLKGWATLIEGEAFEQLDGVLHQGPLHPWISPLPLAEGPIQGGFEARFDEEGRRGTTRSLLYQPGTGAPIYIDDTTPLNVEGYRLGVSLNLGFTALLRWVPDNGSAEVLGGVDFPDIISEPDGQGLEWTLPNGEPIWTGLEILSPRKSFFYPEFRVPERYQLVVRHQQQRHPLQEGEALLLPGGQLRFESLHRWIGYEVFYDWTIPWLLATCLLAIGFLGWYLWERVTSTPWNRADQPEYTKEPNDA